MKTIGVIGGIGPHATMDFETRVHRVSQKLIPQKLNGGHPPMIVHYCRHPPIKVREDGQAIVPLEADPRFIDAARRLGPLVDFLVIISNGAHALAQQVEQASGRKVLSMIDATIAEVRRCGWKRVGVLTLGGPMIYTRPLEALGIACETIEDDSGARDRLYGAIFRSMEGHFDEEGQSAARDAVATLRKRGVEAIILGCTEIPLLYGAGADSESDVINPTQCLAEATVKHAMT